ncbi:helix-turn-helix domain-containing protein [Aminobacter carboxidus]|uniref:Helix-turn-helix transcriptional regulator n=1 Tax=Aminobacter carboxidus TaxID=376165 RepID=A0ABR9GXN1_9HYPH|nr:helix-turn-helix transcriptional regulator [Aminobacter carboxidus]MBE1208437.1 helix-turn-helix transcriptional regulator [Aminobacter carboxidus]
MSIATPFALPAEVLSEIANGMPAIQAYRQYLGYSISAVAVTSGLTVSEVESIEAGHRFEKGYRDRIARALGLPEGIFDQMTDVSDAA